MRGLIVVMLVLFAGCTQQTSGGTDLIIREYTGNCTIPNIGCCVENPSINQVTVTSLDTGSTFIARTGADGKTKLMLIPGSYKLEYRDCEGQKHLMDVRIDEGGATYTKTSVTDTGIAMVIGEVENKLAVDVNINCCIVRKYE